MSETSTPPPGAPDELAGPLVTDAMLHDTAEKVGVCVRPLLRRLVDTETGEDRVIAMPCGSTRERVCKPCADKARRVRIHQCREGWHRSEEFPEDERTDERDEPSEDPPEAGAEDEEDEGRKRRTTRRREDAPELPTVPMDQRRTVAAPMTSPNGNTYRPSMFLTLTLPSYGPVNADGTPKHPDRYDYRRAALDAIHFAGTVDRFWQNLRRCAGFHLQYFACVEPQRRLALHLHAAVRGVVTASVFRQVVAATYHQVWWPKHDKPVYTGGRLPEWSEHAGDGGGYVDPATREPLTTWARAMRALDHDDAEPAHVVWFGSQVDHRWFLAGTARADKRIGYLTKYLTKAIAETYDPDEITRRQEQHRDRLHREARWLPCSTKCANWLRFGIQPEDPEPGMTPGECDGKAHQLDNLGHGGRRVLVSRKWSGKTLTEHRADRAEVVRQALASAGMDMPDQDRCSATVLTDDGRPATSGSPSTSARTATTLRPGATSCAGPSANVCDGKPNTTKPRPAPDQPTPVRQPTTLPKRQPDLGKDEMNQLLTVEQAAELLGTTSRFPRRLIEERRIRFVRVGRHVRIPADALADFIEAATVEPIEVRWSGGRVVA